MIRNDHDVLALSHASFAHMTQLTEALPDAVMLQLAVSMIAGVNDAVWAFVSTSSRQMSVVESPRSVAPAQDAHRLRDSALPKAAIADEHVAGSRLLWPVVSIGA